MSSMTRAVAMLLALVLSAAACGTTSPSALPSPSPSPAGSPTPAASLPLSTAAGPRPIVIDTDLAADDILAIMVLLRDPKVDVRGIAVDGTGEVRCPAGLRNARRLVAAFGRADIPVACGREDPGPAGRWFPSEWRDGADAFYGVQLPAVDGESERLGEQAPQLLDRVAAAAKASGHPLTVVALGPWTNLADALEADPAFTANLAGIHAMGGTIDAPGNIDTDTTSPSDQVEWNFGIDPDALAAVMATNVPVTMVGLDATNHVPVPPDIEQTLATDTAAAGADIAHELYLRNPFLIPGSSFWDTLAGVLLLDPSIATWDDLRVRVEMSGRSAGRTVRDTGGRPVHVAMTADGERFMTAFLAGLRTGAGRPGASQQAGTLMVEWDGTTCRVTETPSGPAGDVAIRVTNRSGAPVALQVAGVTEPHRWQDALDWVRGADLSDPGLSLPGWIEPVSGASLTANAGQSTSGLASLSTGTFGVACATGDWPKIKLHDGGAFTVGG
jgi:inosine-uridine nucleoside N-ribohydrolase